MEAYGARRRQEMSQLWLVIRHAQGSEEDRPDSILPRQASGAVPEDDEPDAFDPVAMVRQARQAKGE